MGMSDLYLPLFTKPLIRRLRADADATEAFKAVLGDPTGVCEDSPIFAGPWDPIADAHAELQPLQRVYLFAVALRQAGALSQQDAASATGVLAARRLTPSCTTRSPTMKARSASPFWTSQPTDNGDPGEQAFGKQRLPGSGYCRPEVTFRYLGTTYGTQVAVP